MKTLDKAALSRLPLPFASLLIRLSLRAQAECVSLQAEYQSGARVFAEQTSHHPPVSSWQILDKANRVCRAICTKGAACPNQLDRVLPDAALCVSGSTMMHAYTCAHAQGA